MEHFTLPLNNEFPFINSKVRLDCYIKKNLSGDTDRLNRAVLIFPGGAYKFVSDREAEPVALEFLAKGFSAFVLTYSVKDSGSIFPAQLIEAAAAMKYIKDNASGFMIDKNKVSVCGFSAGGHLAATFGCLHNSKYVRDVFGEDDLKPCKMILSYPVLITGLYSHSESINNITGGREEYMDTVSLEKQVTADTPPAFIWHTADDGSVPSINSLLFATELARRNIEYELHVYPRGPHGLSLANDVTNVNISALVDDNISAWIDSAVKFLKL